MDKEQRGVICITKLTNKDELYFFVGMEGFQLNSSYLFLPILQTEPAF